MLLFNDAYIEHNEPELGIAAIRVLEKAGYRVDLSPPLDSQRPALSQGRLDVAKKRGQKVFETLKPWVDKGFEIAVVEPSCASALTQDLPDLVENRETAALVVTKIHCIEKPVADALEQDPNRFSWRSDLEKFAILLHTHCHQKAMDGGSAVSALLAAIPGATVNDSDAGCCGMAGGFGYEKDHYDLSVKVAEERLLPAIREAGEDTLLAAAGFSCRHQIADLAGREALHPIAIFDRCLA
jgi:Fe-S oxidoreductase